MNKSIAAAYERTEDAVLVDKYFHDEIKEDFLSMLVLKEYASIVLAEARRRETEADMRKRS